MTDAACLPLTNAMRSLQLALDHLDAKAARRTGLARNDLRCVHLLVSEGQASPKRIMGQLALTSGSVTTLVDRLEALGWVKRSPDPADRRGVRVCATAKAKREITQIYAEFEAVLAKLAQRMGEPRTGAAAKQLDDLARVVSWAVVRD
ncbi:MAG: MarR family transcriptional regulator [Pseudomonadota bacterium]